MESTDILKEISSEDIDNMPDSAVLVRLAVLALHEVKELTESVKSLHDIRACIADAKAREKVEGTPASDHLYGVFDELTDALTELSKCRGEQIKTVIDTIIAYGQAPSEGLADKVRDMALSVESSGEHMVSLFKKYEKALSGIGAIVGSTLDYVPDGQDSAEEQDNVSGNGEDS